MTLTEAQTIRAACLATIQLITAGGAAEYTEGAGGATKSVTKLDLPMLLDQLAKYDFLIDRLQNGPFSVVQFPRR